MPTPAETSSGNRRTASVVPVDPRGIGFLRSRWDIVAVIAVGGALGSLGRWGLSEVLAPEPGRFPWSSFVENVSGGMALGCLMVLMLDAWPAHRLVRPFVGVGLLGGYTTFSTYMLDTRDLLAEGHVLTATTYLFGSLVSGLAAVWLAIALTRRALDRTRGQRVGAEPSPRAETDRRKQP